MISQLNLPAGMDPANLVYLLLLAAGLMWLVIGTITIRWSCAAVNLFPGGSKPAGTEGAPPQHRITPDVSTAVGMVLLNALIQGAAVGLIYCYELAMRALGGAPLPIQSAGLLAVAFLIGPGIIVGVNRKALRTTWLRAGAVTLGYFTMTTLFLSSAYLLLLYALGK